MLLFAQQISHTLVELVKDCAEFDAIFIMVSVVSVFSYGPAATSTAPADLNAVVPCQSSVPEPQPVSATSMDGGTAASRLGYVMGNSKVPHPMPCFPNK